MNKDKIWRMIQENNIQNIDFKYSDLNGRWYHISFPVERFDTVLEKGISFDGSSIPGMKAVEAGDLIMLPHLETAWIEPFWDVPTLSFIANIFEADTRRGIKKDPRSVAIRAENYLKATNIADSSLWGPEIEYYIFDKAVFNTSEYSSYYYFSSARAIDSMNENDITAYAEKARKGYHIIHPFDTYYHLREEVVKIAKEAGIKIKYHHSEVGLAGQEEIELERIDLVKAADAIFLLKHIIRNVSYRNNKYVTFMPKPLYNLPGNGLHFHIQLLKDNENIFYDENAYAGLSKIAISFIVGILKHAPALTLFTNPSTNSFKRLVPGFEAPVKLFFGVANRSAAIRIPKYAVSKEEKRMEFRPSDATCNPYLAMSAILMAGIDGVLNGYTLEGTTFGPYDDNVFEWPESKRKALKSLPANLSEAIDAINQDYEFLLKGNVFDKKLIEDYIELKKKEIQLVETMPHPQEMVLYFNL
jgi:glutamine synthetase